MPRTLYEHLHIVCPCLLCKFTEHVQLKELRLIVGIMDRTGSHTVAQGNRNIIFT